MYSIYADLRDKKGLKDVEVARELGFHSAFFLNGRKAKVHPNMTS